MVNEKIGHNDTTANNAQSAWDSIGKISDAETGHNEERTNSEILESESARNILPYLTLDKLNQEDKAKILSLADMMLDRMYGHGRGLPKDKFDRVHMVERAVANASSEERFWEDGRITPKLRQARKLFCASLLNATRNDDNPHAKWDIYNSFFGISPGVTSYCGGLSDSLELLTIAERADHNPCASEIYEEIILDYSFSQDNGFEKVFEDSSPVQQLRLLPIYNSIALRCDTEGYNSVALSKILQTLDDVESDPNIGPLVKIVTEAVDDNISRWFNSDWVEFDRDDPEYADLIENDKKMREAWQQKQDSLHEEFPLLPANREIVEIAPNIAATISSNTVDMLADKSGECVSPVDYSEHKSFGLDYNTATLLGAAHNSGIKELIDEKLGVDLAKIPLGAQIQLLKFMTGANSDRFDKLCDTLRNVNNDLRVKITEGFVAADFGEDFGDALLTIAGSERLSSKEKERFFDTIGSCRESIQEITELYNGIDNGQFAREYARAANERLTDATMVFDQIAKSNKAGADLDWAGYAKFDFNSAMEALNYEARSLEIMRGTLGAVANGEEGAFAEVVMHPDSSIQRLQRTVYNFYSPKHGYVLLYTRPEGSHSFDAMVEYGKNRNRYDANSVNAGVEASISLITNPVDPFSLPSPYRPNNKALRNPRFYDPVTMDKVSAIRLDREGRAPGAAADDPNRDPINSVGMVSVDLAAIGDRADTPSGKIARLLSVGGKLREKTAGVGSSLNHNTKWFSQEQYGTADGFRRLVEYIDEMATEWCNEHKPDSSSESFNRLMKQARGSKAWRAA